MNTKTLAIAIVSLMAVSGSAMAATAHRSHGKPVQSVQEDIDNARAQATRGFSGVYGNEGDGQAIYNLPGRTDVDASEPGWNPALDRAKGGL
jgi:hypothetical protein